MGRLDGEWQTHAKNPDDVALGRAWLDQYFGLARRECSAWEWFLLKAGNSVKTADRLWRACDADLELKRRREAMERGGI